MFLNKIYKAFKINNEIDLSAERLDAVQMCDATKAS